MRNYEFNLASVDLNPKSLGQFDAVIVCTDHDDFDYKMIIENADLVIDTRGIYKRGKFSEHNYSNLYLS
jgi:UDP-N-acetyl-D-glucosamine dehydrogenase